MLNLTPISVEDFYLEEDIQSVEYYGKRVWFECPFCNQDSFTLIKSCHYEFVFITKGYDVGRCCKNNFKIILN